MNPALDMISKTPNRIDSVFFWYIAATSAALKLGEIGGMKPAKRKPARQIPAKPNADQVQINWLLMFMCSFSPTSRLYSGATIGERLGFS
jgi:hypothetical protein